MPERTTGISGGISGRPARQELSNLQPAKNSASFSSRFARSICKSYRLTDSPAAANSRLRQEERAGVILWHVRSS